MQHYRGWSPTYILNGLMFEDIKNFWDYVGTYGPLSRKILTLLKQRFQGDLKNLQMLTFDLTYVEDK